MSLHYLNPDDEPRECECIAWKRLLPARDVDPCKRCNGTGRLGNPESRPRIEVQRVGGHLYDHDQRFYWRRASDPPSALYEHGPYPTEALALAAARRALGGGR